MKVEEVVLRDLVLEKQVVQMLAVGNEGSQADVVLHAVGLHGVAWTAIIDEFIANLAV